MGKHAVNVADGELSPRPPKKRKHAQIDQQSDTVDATYELKRWLTFHQDRPDQLVSGLRKARTLLGRIKVNPQGPENERSYLAVREWLMKEVPKPEDRFSPACATLFQAWSYAAQCNHDALLIAIPEFLALLLHVTSKYIDLRATSLHLCLCLLKKEALRHFDRAFESSQARHYLISVTLQLLTEILSFDGGASARSLYLKRHVTFKNLEHFLVNTDLAPDAVNDGQRLPLRAVALQYILSNLRYQSSAAKEDLITQRSLMRPIFIHLRYDPPQLSLQAVNEIRATIVADNFVDRKAKAKLFSEHALTCMTRLGRARELQSSSKIEELREAAETLLLTICTFPEAGVLKTGTSWYPAEESSANDFKSSVPVQNLVLASFISNLKPYAIPQHRSLMMAIFAAAPELVAGYFIRHQNFTLEPKLSSTWVGWISFITAVCQQPLAGAAASVHARDEPPPIEILLQSIIPRPVTQKALSRCINQYSGIIKYLAVQMLVASLQKFQQVYAWLRRHDLEAWQAASQTLQNRLATIVPEFRHVIAAYRSCASTDALLRASLARLILLYFDAVPSLAVTEPFDISARLVEILQRTEIVSAEMRWVESQETESLVAIAARTDMRWWSKPERLPSTPFLSMLLWLADPAHGAMRGVSQLLAHVGAADHIFVPEKANVYVLGLIARMEALAATSARDQILAFLDNSFQRCARRPLKYAADVAAIFAHNSPSPILAVIVEQWSYFCDHEGESLTTATIQWLSTVIRNLVTHGESAALMHQFHQKLLAIAPDDVEAEPLDNSVGSELATAQTNQEADEIIVGKNPTTIDEIAFDELSLSLQPPRSTRHHPVLARHTKFDAADLVEDGQLSDLILCLSSEHQEIRLQALQALRSIMRRLKDSDYTEWQQMYVLLGEICETCGEHAATRPLPGFVSVFAARAIRALSQPLHPMYKKLNAFLNESPSWHVSRMPALWITKIFYETPERDDAGSAEILWLLEVLLDGLRTSEDMELYRRCAVFESCMSLSTSPVLAESCFEAIIHLLLRATFIDGGSTTLATRCAVCAWIESLLQTRRGLPQLLKALISRLQTTLEASACRIWGLPIA